MVQRDRPEWGPLVTFLGETFAEDFMWMYEVRLDDGQRIDAYKHVDTRRYLHLTADGRLYGYVEGRRYREVDRDGVWWVLPRWMQPPLSDYDDDDVTGASGSERIR